MVQTALKPKKGGKPKSAGAQKRKVVKASKVTKGRKDFKARRQHAVASSQSEISKNINKKNEGIIGGKALNAGGKFFLGDINATAKAEIEKKKKVLEATSGKNRMEERMKRQLDKIGTRKKWSNKKKYINPEYYTQKDHYFCKKHPISSTRAINESKRWHPSLLINISPKDKTIFFTFLVNQY